MADLIEPEKITVTDGNGNGYEFILSKFPAIQGREIVSKYPLSNMPKLGDYAVSEETMLKLMAFVGKELEGGVIMKMDTRNNIANQIKDWEVLAKLEVAMLEKNCSFFRNGRISGFLEGFAEKVQAKILETLTGLSAQSSPTEKQPSTN